MKTKYEDKIRDLFLNEKFVVKFKDLESIEKIGELFKEFDVEMTEEELIDFIKAAIESDKKSELDESAMENVAGGAPWWLVGAAWNFAVDYWGGTQEACVATCSYWYNVFTK